MEIDVVTKSSNKSSNKSSEKPTIDLLTIDLPTTFVVAKKSTVTTNSITSPPLVTTYSTSPPMMISQKQPDEEPVTVHQGSPLISSLIKSTFSPIVKTIKPKSKSKPKAQTKIKKLIKEDPGIDILETIKLAYKELIDDPDCAYKMCNHQYLVIMQKTPETRTNETRKDVADPKCARFRANILNVILIINVLDGKIIDTIDMTDLGSMVDARATIGQPLESELFDSNLSIYSHGLYYFNSIEPAFYGRYVPEHYTGQWIKYYDNGNKSARANYIDGKKEGIWLYWEEPGYLSHKETYLNDKENGDWVSWCGDIKICKGSYIDGKRQGIWTYWRFNKTKHHEIFYIDDREDHVILYNNSSSKINSIVKKKVD